MSRARLSLRAPARPGRDQHAAGAQWEVPRAADAASRPPALLAAEKDCRRLYFAAGSKRAQAHASQAPGDPPDELPPWARCPVCLAALEDPVVTPCGHSFCKGCFAAACVASRGTCAVCRADCVGVGGPGAQPRAFPQLALRDAVHALPCSCRWRARGCLAELTQGQAAEHEAACGRAPALCDECGEVFCQEELHAHHARCAAAREAERSQDKAKDDLIASLRQQLAAMQVHQGDAEEAKREEERARRRKEFHCWHHGYGTRHALAAQRAQAPTAEGGSGETPAKRPREGVVPAEQVAPTPQHAERHAQPQPQPEATSQLQQTVARKGANVPSWVGQPLGPATGGKKRYSALRKDGDIIRVGDVIFMLPGSELEEMYVAKVNQMWEATASGRKVIACQWLERGSSAPPGLAVACRKAGRPPPARHELFLTDLLDTNDVSSIEGRVTVYTSEAGIVAAAGEYEASLLASGNALPEAGGSADLCLPDDTFLCTHAFLPGERRVVSL